MNAAVFIVEIVQIMKLLVTHDKGFIVNSL